MRRADAAGGEQIVVARAQLVDRGDDRGLVVGDDAHLLQANADARKMRRDVVDVAVAGAAREDLVADHQHRRRDDVFAAQRHFSVSSRAV